MAHPVSASSAAILTALALAAACGRDALPPQVTIEEVVADVAPPLMPSATVEQAVPRSVRQAVLQPGERLFGAGPRPSLIVPPPAAVRVRLDVPADAVLRFAAAVDGEKRKQAGRSGVEFRVLVDGHERFAETLNPAAARGDRRWLEGEVDLRPEAGRQVEITLRTSAQDARLPLAGTPGWSHVRLVRKTTRERQPASPSKPNLLVLLVDNQRADRLGVYGAHPSPSPTLDRLAASGIVFQDAVSQSSWTMPSVASTLTGLHPRSHGAVGDEGGRELPDDRVTGTSFLADGVVTWAELAQQAGITTIGVSSNPIVSRATNFAQGFERFVDLPWDSRAHLWPAAADVNRTFLDWLARNRKWRFAAYLHYMEPHEPYTPPRRLRPAPPAGVRPAVAAGRIFDLARAINFHGAPPLSAVEIDHLSQLYDGEVRTWDAALAALLAGLASAGVLDSTIVIVTADHGEEFQEHGRLMHGSHLYEESIRVPLVIAGPGVSPGRRADTAQGIDILPTIVSLLGLAAPAGLPGRDLLATRTAGDVVSETGGGVGPNGGFTDVIALRTSRWKLIRTPELGRVELYDLVADAREETAREADAPEAQALAARLDRWAAAAPPPPRTAGRDPALRAKLRALGYVE